MKCSSMAVVSRDDGQSFPGFTHAGLAGLRQNTGATLVAT